MVARACPDAIGLNLVESSPRCLSRDMAVQLVGVIGEESRGEIEIIGVVADQEVDALTDLAAELGLDRLQLHGHETPDDLQALLDRGVDAYRAARIATSDDVAAARAFPGERLLVDAKVAGALGGTGQTFDWSLIEEFGAERELILAGGLHAQNVAQAVRQVVPFGVDTASGVEREVGKKDSDLVRAFIRAARGKR